MKPGFSFVRECESGVIALLSTHSSSVLPIAIHIIDRLNNNPTKPSFISPAFNAVDIANMTGIGLIRICKDSLKPSTQQEVGKLQLSLLRIAGFTTAIRTYCIGISGLVRE
jgi:hypothetical protein